MGRMPLDQSQNHSAEFARRLSANKTQIEVALAQFLVDWRKEVSHLGSAPMEAVEIFGEILSRGGKRIRGALAIESYRMFGGQHDTVALQAALVMELVQTYLLITDDLCDRSDTRRGGPSAHRLLETLYWERGWRDTDHVSQSMAMVAAMLGMHRAMLVIDGLEVERSLRLRALANLNNNLSVTIQGQMLDMYNQISSTSKVRDVEQAITLKTAYYTFVNPLQFGAILADADDVLLGQLRDFSLPAGLAYQIQDDVIGVFSDEQDSGKSPLDDLREGKRTLMVVDALEQASPDDQAFLLAILGNPNISMDDVQRCRAILTGAGSRQRSEQTLAEAINQSRSALEGVSTHASEPGIAFLDGMLSYLSSRTV
jgi:geranylgeranyl diphosphate synthase type I